MRQACVVMGGDLVATVVENCSVDRPADQPDTTILVTRKVCYSLLLDALAYRCVLSIMLSYIVHTTVEDRPAASADQPAYGNCSDLQTSRM